MAWNSIYTFFLPRNFLLLQTIVYGSSTFISSCSSLAFPALHYASHCSCSKLTVAVSSSFSRNRSHILQRLYMNCILWLESPRPESFVGTPSTRHPFVSVLLFNYNSTKPKPDSAWWQHEHTYIWVGKVFPADAENNMLHMQPPSRAPLFGACEWVFFFCDTSLHPIHSHIWMCLTLLKLCMKYLNTGTRCGTIRCNFLQLTHHGNIFIATMYMSVAQWMLRVLRYYNTTLSGGCKIGLYERVCLVLLNRQSTRSSGYLPVAFNGSQAGRLGFQAKQHIRFPTVSLGWQ